MYNVTSANSAWNILTGQRTDIDSADGSFAGLFSGKLQGISGNGNRSGISDMLAKLAERFPNADVKESAAPKSAEDADKVFGTEAGDNVAVESGALASMFGNSGLFQQIEDALSSFFNSDAGSNAVSGAYTQRNVSITITTVSFQVVQRDGSTGDVLSSQELQSALQDKIKELVDRIFGRSSVAEAADAEDDDTETEAAADDTAAAGSSEAAESATDLWKGFSMSSWSMSLYYSNTLIQSLGNQNGQNGQNSQNMMQSLQFSASYLSYAGGFQDFANNYLPQSIFGNLGSNNSLNGPFTSLLEGGLGQLGLTSGGFSQTTDGFLFNLRNGRDFLSEMLELAGFGKNPAVTGSTEEEEVEVADEAPASEPVGAES